jgi:hypothetical protein
MSDNPFDRETYEMVVPEPKKPMSTAMKIAVNSTMVVIALLAILLAVLIGGIIWKGIEWAWA